MSEKSIIEKPVTANFVCKVIGVSRPALHKWSKAGIVRSHKLGGKLFYFETEVMEDLKKC
jgi:predicted site-specific integrase-resolvase